MPLYAYQCEHCSHVVEMLRPMAQRNELAECIACKKGQLHLQISAPRSVIIKGGPFRAATPQQQLAGPKATGPGTHQNIRNSVLHQCKGPNCSVCG
ncbi:MAG TPA: zinc ribbon domain-containing protein [Thiohalobacter sp.]|nr:zinc ribbon domain-containing protein [Thiohalobacter sp.]